jgi:hypothetical protein
MACGQFIPILARYYTKYGSYLSLPFPRYPDRFGLGLVEAERHDHRCRK